MRRLLQKAGSLKLTVPLVLLIGLVLSAGTILESLEGAERARAVYDAPWFYALQGLFALNLVCALIDRWPTNRWRIGFALTHVSILLILVGALLTVLFKTDGQMAIREGERSSTVALRPSAGREPRSLALPFAVALDTFELDLYPGTDRPAMFRSRIQVLDPSAPGVVRGIIEMNRPFSYGGYRFFQSSYRIEQDGRTTVLAVSRDLGQPIVFFGYVLLVAGMIVVFSTRLVQAQRNARPAERSGLPVLPALAAILAILAAAPPARAAQVPDAAAVEKLRTVPVQHDGRSMPLDTQAREEVRTVSGTSSFWGLDPVAIVLGWTFHPDEWQSAPIVKLGGAEVPAAIGLPPGTRFASFGQLLAAPRLRDAVSAARESENAGRKPTRLDKDLLKIEERLSVLYRYFRGTGLAILPAPDTKGTWQPVGGIRSADELVTVARSIRANGAPPHYPSDDRMRREVTYNAARPGRIAWVLLLAAALAAGTTVARDRARLRLAGGVLLVAGFAAMTWGLATRWVIAGRIPASDMYESMLFLGWGVGLFGVVALALRQRLLVANAAGLGALAMMLTDLLPMDPFIHPVMPVLSGTPWLAIHVPIIVISYSVLAMATGLAHLVLGVGIFAPARRDLAARWSQLLYWYLHVGSILLIAGILTGSIWAASSWGRYWGWDPKEVWSLIAFLAYMAILHARFDEQLRDFGVAVSSIAAFWTILMTYLGVNFVLATGLHAYGFGSSNLVLALAAVAAVEIAFLGAAWLARRRSAPAAARA